MVGLSVIVKICVLFATVFIFNSFVDTFDHQYYLQNFINVMDGKIPYADFGFDYPPLAFLPIALAFLPALLFNSAGMFILSFQALMILFDAVIVCCVYLIGLKLYPERTAFLAGILYATAFAGAYFVLTKYDAFPTALLMIAILFAVYRKPKGGYLSATAGLLAKIYPAVALPFIVLYNSAVTSLKEEVYSILKILIPILVILGVPILVFRPSIITSYIGGSLVRSDVYVNTATNTIYALFNNILHVSVSANVISAGMYGFMVVALLILLFYGWIVRIQKEKMLIKLVALALFVIVFCMKYHSPQYILWFLPLVCLLVADSLAGIAMFYITQVVAYIEFPLAFGTLYVNTSYVSPVDTPGWYFAWLFFAVESVLFIVLMYLAVRPTRAHIDRIRAFFQKAGTSVTP
ncbi:hypothetical protein [Methanoregula sp.]|uniref:hypothetical protein n=1 Tax=Methanoregula sp. TaxID=2052170 RepID=UPI00260EEBA4|nr:hypothetical protein [Methanoregula sp.]MDD5142611.1 hypothetical protein [Methanoregula sp.]